MKLGIAFTANILTNYNHLIVRTKSKRSRRRDEFSSDSDPETVPLCTKEPDFEKVKTKETCFNTKKSCLNKILALRMIFLN